MRILDETGRELLSPDYSAGYLTPERALIARHPAVREVKEQAHYEILRSYPNGGRDVRRVVDVPGVAGSPAWDEYEDILRYRPYTPEQLRELEKPTPREDTDAMLIDHELRLTLLELGEG